MKPKPTLAVLITYYNEGATLTKCLESVLNQAFPPEEILIYDDASQLPPAAFIPPGANARILREEKNHGPAYGRNRLLEACTADYLHFHDADDLLEPDWSTTVRQLLDEKNPDAIFVEIANYEGPKLLTDRVIELRPMATADELIRFCLRHAILTSSGIYRTALVRQLGGYRESLWQSEDYDFHVRVAAAPSVTFEIVTRALIRRTREAGRSANRREVWASVVDATEHLAKELPDKYHRDLADAASWAGSKLFQLGARENARRAFKLAAKLGPSEFRQMQGFYRPVAKWFGPEIAEWVGLVYRGLFPITVRRWARRLIRD